MYCSQINVSLPSAGLLLKQSDPRRARIYQSLSQPSYLHVSSASGSSTFSLRNYEALLRLTFNASKYKKNVPLYAYSQNENHKRQNKVFSWGTLKNTIEAFIRGRSVEDSLRRQMQEQKNGGRGGRSPPSNGGNGGSGGPEDKQSAENLDELLQVIMATIGFIFVYIFLTSGDGLMRLSRDYIRFLFGAKASARLLRTMDKWKSFSEILTTSGAKASAQLQHTMDNWKSFSEIVTSSGAKASAQLQHTIDKWKSFS